MRVVGELGKIEKTYLVMLFGGDIVAEVLFEHSVDLLSLTIRLWVEGNGEVELCTE